MKATTYLLGYKDSENDKVRYFGPFVSLSVAEFFQASLPMPLKGGWARIVQIEPFLAHEGHTVSQLILKEREEAKV